MWDTRYTGDSQIISFSGKTPVEMVDSKGKVKIVHIAAITYVLPADSIISKLPDYQSSGRQSRLRIDYDIPNLKWVATVTINTNFLAVSSK